MKPNEMINKYCVPVFISFALLILAEIYYPQVCDAQYSIKPSKRYLASQAFIYQLNFAHERLPLYHSGVMLKMSRALVKHSYKNINSYILHQKARMWFPIIEPILKQYGIPDDFKYIPLVESGLRGGMSAKGANGYWQFMPNTARGFGLKVNTEIDERKDLRKSTIAACKYLKMLHSMFNSWTLTAAAYNYGDNNIRRQIKKQQKSNYFKLVLNEETANYVYSLIAMKEIIVSPRHYGYAPSKTLLAYAN